MAQISRAPLEQGDGNFDAVLSPEELTRELRRVIFWIRERDKDF